MPAELQAELIRSAPPTSITFELEPAHNMLYSLMLLNFAEQTAGRGRVGFAYSNALSPERRHNNRLVLEGLHYAVAPRRSFRSFDEYVTDLEATDTLELRDRLLERLTTSKVHDLPHSVHAEPAPDVKGLLDKEAYHQLADRKISRRF